MPSSQSSSVFVGRQQIYDRNRNVVAYELLFRSSGVNVANVRDGDIATSQLLVNAIVEIGLENLVDSRPAFVNFTRGFLVGNVGIPLDPGQIVIEVLESVEPDEAVIAALQRLRQEGRTIALDDYVESDHRQALLELANIVKVDIRTFNPEMLASQVQYFRSYPLQLLAEKVETNEEYQYCKDLGFDLFQGYFLSRPEVVEGKSISNNQFAMLQLLVKLRDPEVGFDDVVELVKQNVVLSLKLLKYVNSLAHGVRREIDSVRQATVRLGMQRVRQIVSLMVMTGLGDKPQPLLDTALIRARMCELLGVAMRLQSSEVCFTVGLFSILDALLDRPLEEILHQLPIAPEVQAAVLQHAGEMGRILDTVMAFQQGDWDRTGQLDLNDQELQNAYLDAVAWSGTMLKADD